jgi:hypothetical protein
MQKSSDGEHLTSEIISQYISAYVDAANNPFIFYMNGSLKVAPTLIYMAFFRSTYKTSCIFSKPRQY